MARGFPNHEGRNFPIDSQRDFPLAGSTAVVAPGIAIAVTSFLTPTSTGVITISTPDMNGVTPKAVILIATNHDDTDDPGEANHAQISIGMADDTNEGWAVTWSKDGEANTDVRRAQNVDGMLRIYDATTQSTTLVHAVFSAFVEDGVSINFTTADSNRKRVIAIMFGGADLNAHANFIDLGTGTSAIDVTDPGFEPDFIFLAGAASPNNEISSFYLPTIGMCVNDGSETQKCLFGLERDGQATGDVASIFNDGAAWAQINAGKTAQLYEAVISDFDANGFSITPSASAANDDALYLALEFVGRSVAIVQFDTPTSTGADVVDPGFEPEFYLGAISSVTVVDTLTDSGGIGISAGTEDFQASASVRIENGAATTNTGSETKDVALQGASDTDANAILASLTSLDGSGATFNYTAVLGAGQKASMFFVSAA